MGRVGTNVGAQIGARVASVLAGNLPDKVTADELLRELQAAAEVVRLALQRTEKAGELVAEIHTTLAFEDAELLEGLLQKLLGRDKLPPVVVDGTLRLRWPQKQEAQAAEG